MRRIRRENAAAENLAPANKAGYLYYVRLQTEFGRFYKLGYTKSDSVEKRFNYGDADNYKLVDKELLFVHLDNAYEIEKKLHRHFSSAKSFGTFSSLADFPLYKNGQSELYYSDIFRLDNKRSKFRGLLTYVRVMLHQGEKEYGSKLLSALLLTTVGVSTFAFAIFVVMPIGWILDKTLCKESAIESEREFAAIDLEYRNLIDYLKKENYAQAKL